MGKQEGLIQFHLMDGLTKLGCVVRKAKWENRRGCPDLFVAHAALPREIWPETKAANGKLSALQVLEQEKLTAAGVDVRNIWSKEDADLLIEEVRQCVSS